MSEFKTPNGKVIVTYNVPGTAHVGIKFTTGGELPTELSGLFTSVRVADQMIGAYLGKLETVKEKPAKGR
jgi:hypothetical protein